MLVLLLSRERSSFQRSCVFPFPHHPQLQLHLAYCSFPWEALPLIFSQLVWVYAKSLQSCLTLCNPMNCSLQGSSVHGIFQARTLKWVAISFSKRSFQHRDWTLVACLTGRFFTTEPSGKPHFSRWYILKGKGSQGSIDLGGGGRWWYHSSRKCPFN